MEQFFIILAVVVFWIFKGVAGGQRRVPGSDPYDTDSTGPGGHMDIAGTTSQKTLEAQRTALEALQRWEAKQRLASGYGGPPAAPEPEVVSAASRTRVGRPAGISGRAGDRQRKEAYADIARMLDPGQSTGSPAGRSRFKVDARDTPTSGRPKPPAPEAVPQRRPSEAAEKRAEAKKAAVGAEKKTPAPRSALARVESLPLLARAIVYSEILGRPRSLS